MFTRLKRITSFGTREEKAQTVEYIININQIVCAIECYNRLDDTLYTVLVMTTGEEIPVDRSYNKICEMISENNLMISENNLMI
jgi:hypothetical protein